MCIRCGVILDPEISDNPNEYRRRRGLPDVPAVPQPSATCARCGALEADHLDYGRAALLCPTTSGGTFQPKC